MNLLFLSACAVLLVVPLIFVIHEVYEDGLIGRIGLLGISFSAATFLLETAAGEVYVMLPQTVMLVVSFAIFISWHLTRWHGIVLRQKKKEKSEHQQKGTGPNQAS